MNVRHLPLRSIKSSSFCILYEQGKALAGYFPTEESYFFHTSPRFESTEDGAAMDGLYAYCSKYKAGLCVETCNYALEIGYGTEIGLRYKL